MSGLPQSHAKSTTVPIGLSAAPHDAPKRPQPPPLARVATSRAAEQSAYVPIRDDGVGAPPRPAAASAPRHGRYALAWGAVGLLAGGYVMAVLIHQDAGQGLAQGLSTRDAAETTATVVKTQAEVAHLQRTVGSLESDMARLKTGAAQQDEREKELASRVSVVETRIEQFTTTLTQTAQPTAALARPATKAQTATANPPKAIAPNAANIKTGALPSPDAATGQRERSHASRRNGRRRRNAVISRATGARPVD